MSEAQFVQVIVGGLPYSLGVSDIEKFPGSFFECMIKKEWLKDEKPTTIDRDGALFKYVSSFLVSGSLPRDESGRITVDEDTLARLKEEADFFGIGTLSDECSLEKKKTNSDLEGYITIRKYLAKYKCSPGGSNDIIYASDLANALKEIWAPFCLTGTVAHPQYYCKTPLFKSSAISAVNAEELISAATQSAFGRGTETITDTSVRNSFEIPASELNSVALKEIQGKIQVKPLAPSQMLELRPYKLVIYKKGGHFDAHRDTVRGEGHIGTLVVILNSDYTGGELEVSHGGRTEVVTGAYSWVAMYGDCLHKINPVTSGTRVSLIYDIYGTSPSAVENASPTNDEAGEEEEEEEKREDLEAEKNGEDSFWDSSKNRAARFPLDRGVTEEVKRRVLAEMKREIKREGSLIITLQHLYPECQTSPAFLKGGDRALYDLLSEQYDVTVVAATIYRTHDEESDDYNETTFTLFAAGDASHKKQTDTEEAAAKKRRITPGPTRLLITNQFDTDGLLDYTPYIEHTGNESQAEETVYIVAGLQVQKRAV